MDQSFGHNSQSQDLSESTYSRSYLTQPTIPQPAVLQSLLPYQMIKKQLFAHFFEQKQPQINNKVYCQAYIKPYELINQSQFKINKGKTYQRYQQTLLNRYQEDLTQFAMKVYEHLMKNLLLNDAQEFIRGLCRWINIYVKFNYLIHRIFVVIQRSAIRSRGNSLYCQGLMILKRCIIQKLQNRIYSCVFDCLQKFKESRFKSMEQLHIVIKYIGITGFVRSKQIGIMKLDSRYEYTSLKLPQQQSTQTALKTKLFFTSFITYNISSLQQYYTSKTQESSTLSVQEYLLQVNSWIQNEQRVISHFYNTKKIHEKMISVIAEILIIDKRQNILRSCIKVMIQSVNLDNLSLLYKLYKKANIIKKFYAQFQSYIEQQGENIIKPLLNDLSFKSQTVKVINAIVKLYTNVIAIKNHITGEDVQFQIAINFGFQNFCNKGNHVYSALAHYIDSSIKKEALSSDKIDQFVSLIEKISKYFYSYDYFIKIHQKLLALRLLYYQKCSQTQYALVNLIKMEAGTNAASKLVNMMTDIETSQAWNHDFQLKKKLSFTLQVTMLTGSSWQLPYQKKGKSLVLGCLKKAVQEYQQFFLQKMPHRRIDWIFTHGRSVIQIFCNNNAKYTLFLNNYQLIILLYMQENAFKPTKYVQLLYHLKIDDEPFFKHSLLALIKAAVVVRNDNSDIKEDINEISINFDLKSKSQKISCSIFPKYYQKVAVIDNELSIQRNILIDAALIKLMKQRKRQAYVQIISEVIKMCKNFKAEIHQIKLRIQQCLQRQLLQRDSEDFNFLIYKP